MLQKETGPSSLYAQKLIILLLEQEAITLGDFNMPCGHRTAPYNVDFSRLHDGKTLGQLCQYYAETILMNFMKDGKLLFDVLFSPVSNKAIHLADTTTMVLNTLGYTCQCAHGGEDGSIIGAQLDNKRVLIIDGTFGAGIIIGEAIEVVGMGHGIPVGLIVGFDRMEEREALTYCHAVDELKKKYNIPVVSITTVKHLIKKLDSDPKYNGDVSMRMLNEKIKEHQVYYGAPAPTLPTVPPELLPELLMLPIP